MSTHPNTIDARSNGTGRTLLSPRQLVDGAWSQPTDQIDQQLCDPATGEPVQSRVQTPSPDIDAAIAAASTAHQDRPDGIGSPAERAAALEHAAELLDQRAEAIAVQDALNSGVPIKITRLFAGALGDTLRSAARQLAELAPRDLSQDGRPVWLYRLPFGPAAILAPWNAPTAVAAKKAAYAWAAGCPVVIKPSPWSPNGTVLLAEAMLTAALAAGLPAASIQLVYGDTAAGQQLAGDRRIRALTFTGSRRGGRAVAATAATDLKALQLELGSNNPAVILPDADLQHTAAALVGGLCKLNGAWCESPGTVFVPAALRESLIDAMREQLATLVVGDPLDDASTFGPQSNAQQWTTISEHIERLAESGARIIQVGGGDDLPRGGFWTMPTLVIDPPAELVREEFFGPMLVIRTCDTAADAINVALQLETGLGGYVFGQDIPEALRVGRLLPVGEVKINGTSLLDLTPGSTQAFWSGSGIGAHGDRELAQFFTGARIVGRDVDSPL